MESKIVQFFWYAAQSIPRESPNAAKLACHYLSKCKQFAVKNGIRICSKLFGTNPMCQHCYTIWTDGKYSFKILPKKTLKKGIRKILNKSSCSPELLTEYERKLLTLHEKRNCNKMVLTCSVCGKKNIILMKKPNRNVKPNSEADVVEDKKKKKRKQKDPFAGLKHSAVIAVNDKAMKVKPKKASAVIKRTTSTSKKIPPASNLTSSHSVLVKDFKRKNTLQKILNLSQAGIEGSSSKLQDFLVGLK